MAVNLKKILFDEKSIIEQDHVYGVQFVVLDSTVNVGDKRTPADEPVHPVRRLKLDALVDWLRGQNVGNGMFPTYMGTYSAGIPLSGTPVTVTLSDETAYCMENNSENGIKIVSDDIEDTQYYTAKVTFTAETTGEASVTISGSEEEERVSYVSSVHSAGQFTADVLIVNLLKGDTEGLKLELSGNDVTVANIRVTVTCLPQKDKVIVDDLLGVLWDELTDSPLATHDSGDSYLATH